MVTRRIGTAFVIGMALLLPACDSGDARKPTFPVTGKLVINGKAAEHATVIFHPVGDADPNAIRPRGKVNADGTFKLTTYDGDDGAPAGKYRVTAEWWLADRKSDAPPSNRLPPKFANADQSGLTAEVRSEPTTLETFAIKR